MQSPGTYISGIGHIGLIGWLILGWGFQSDPLPFEVAEISVVSGDEYAALVAATTPNPGTAEPTAPVTPTEETTPPAPETPPEAAPDTATPPPIAEPAAEAPPPEAPAPPEPPAEVATEAPPAPPQPEAVATVVPAPVTSARPQPRPAPRVAPEAVAPPPEDVAVAPVEQPAVTPDQSAEAEVVQEPVAPAAPEEAATEIVTEADEPSGAVTTSTRPASRPNRPTQAAAAATAPETPAQTSEASSNDAATEAAVAAALAAATASAAAPAVAAGPPMTGSEREGFRVAVNACWNVDPGSVAARVTVVVGFSLDQSGKVSGDVRLVSSDGDQSATDTAYQAARRAILRCQGAGGYQLPPDKYDQWRDVEITFDPSGMRLR